MFLEHKLFSTIHPTSIEENILNQVEKPGANRGPENCKTNDTLIELSARDQIGHLIRVIR